MNQEYFKKQAINRGFFAPNSEETLVVGLTNDKKGVTVTDGAVIVTFRKLWSVVVE